MVLEMARRARYFLTCSVQGEYVFSWDRLVRINYRTDFSEDRDRGFCVRCLGVLLLLTPLLCAQNPDELLVVRLPATQGYINRHATPLPLPTRRSQTATPTSAAKRGYSLLLGPSGVARADDATCRGQAQPNRSGHQELAPLGRGKKPRNPLLR
jgi:hypothetical protein